MFNFFVFKIKDLKRREAQDKKWRRERDSNSWWAINPRRFSRPVHSTALPSLRNTGRIVETAALFVKWFFGHLQSFAQIITNPLTLCTTCVRLTGQFEAQTKMPATFKVAGILKLMAEGKRFELLVGY
jgi:hypothetical protein